MTVLIQSVVLYYLIRTVYAVTKTLEYLKQRLFWSILGIAVQFFMHAYSYFLFVVVLEVSVQNYLAGS